jgi:hypothetical protein
MDGGKVSATNSAVNTGTVQLFFTLQNLTTNGLLNFNYRFSADAPIDSGTPRVSLVASYFVSNSNQTLQDAALVGNKVGSFTLTQLSTAGVTLSGDSTNVLVSTSNPFSMTVELDIVGLDNGKSLTNISFDFGVTEIPEPMSLALLGSGLVGLGLARRKRA